MNRRAATSLRDDDPPPEHPPRVRFDSLFGDPHHFRGDCRLLRAAIRRGRLNDATPEDRAALVARFDAACDEWRARNPDGPEGQRLRGPWLRGLMAQLWAVIEMERDNVRPMLLEARYTFRGEWTGKLTGRPRSRPRASDFRCVIDANAVRRRMLAAGVDLARLSRIVVTTDPPDARGAWAQRIIVAAVRDRVYGWRLWLLCPRCGSRRGKLYPTGRGMRCRACV